MEASGTPTPPSEPTPPAPQPPAPAAQADDERAGAAWRILGVLLALALAFASAVMIVAMVDIAGTPVFEDCVTPLEGGDCTEYFDGSKGQKIVSVILGFVSGGLAAVGTLLALLFAATGRNGRLLMQLTGAAIAFGAASLVIGSI